METKVYAAGEPIPDQWVLQWRSPSMPAPSFWYFKTRQEAKEAEQRMKWPRPDQVY